MDKYFSLKEAGRILGVQPYRIAYAHTTGQVKEPLKVFGKRAYRKSDLSALAKHFGVQPITPVPTVPEKEDNAQF